MSTSSGGNINNTVPKVNGVLPTPKLDFQNLTGLGASGNAVKSGQNSYGTSGLGVASPTLNFQNLPASGLGVSGNAVKTGQNSYGASGLGSSTLSSPQVSSPQVGANPYQMTTQEASGGAAGITAYNNRIASLNGGSTDTGTATGNTGNGLVSTGLGTGGGAAPAGQEYNSQGVLVPKTADSTGTTFNQNSYTATSPTYSGLVGGLTGMASQPTAAYTTAQNTYNEAAKQLKDLQTQEANQLQGIQTSGVDLQAAQGEAGAMQNAALAGENALTGQMTAEQAAMQNATAQQGTQQSGLTAAMQGAAPQAANAMGTYDPTTMQYTQYGGGQGTNGAFTGGDVLGKVALGEQYSSVLVPAYSAAGAIKNDMQSFLAQNADTINPNSLRAGNQLQQWVQGQMSDPKLAAFNQKLNEFLSTATPLVGAMGGMTNFKQSMVNSMLDAMAQGKSVSQAMDTMYTLMGEKLNAIKQSGGSGMTTAPTSNNNNVNPQATNVPSNVFGSFSG